MQTGIHLKVTAFVCLDFDCSCVTNANFSVGFRFYRMPQTYDDVPQCDK